MNDPTYEIERKYLLSGVPKETKTVTGIFIRQGYIPGDILIERIRAKCINGKESYYRTVKFGSGVKRVELEEETTKAIFDVLWSLTTQRRIEKTRYAIADGPFTWEIDVFENRDLILAEIELPHEEMDVTFPDWLKDHVVREVTDDNQFTNWALAQG